MATQRVLTLNASGAGFKEYAPVTSGGTANAGAIPGLNAAGQLDPTMMPPGVAADQQGVTASEAIAAGALVNMWTSSGAVLARNADGSTSGKQADGYVTAAVVSGGTATVLFNGINPAPVGAVSAGLAYLSDTAVGNLMSAGATTAGHTYQQVGVVISGGQLQFNPQQPIVRS